MTTSAPDAFLSIVLHAHLPYVRHPEVERCLEEVWLFEALTDCYLPLLEMLERLERDGVKSRFNLSLSPTLLEMLASPLMQERYCKHMERLIALTSSEVKRLSAEPELKALAQGYEARFEALYQRYKDDLGGDLIGAFVKRHEAGQVRLMTTSATHAFLPLYQHQPRLVEAQIRGGVATFERLTGLSSRSFWVPECGYFKELDSLLVASGISEIVLDTHALTGAQPPSPQQAFAPLRTPEGVLAFGRDPESSRQVWSARQGYPGDFDYREYYSDIGFSLDTKALGAFVLPDGTRIPSGIKYLRVSGGNREKEPYSPKQAQLKAQQHARHFVKSRLQRAQAGPFGDVPVQMVAPYDAELMGHWWFEGPLWLEAVLREVDAQEGLQAVALEDYAEQYAEKVSVGTPAASSWGQAGYNQYWLNDETAWLYPQVHEAGERFLECLDWAIQEGADDSQMRALRQMARTLCLAQASDWPFIIRAGTTTEYALRRIQESLARFRYLEDTVRTKCIDARKLAALEIVDELFTELDLEWFRCRD